MTSGTHYTLRAEEVNGRLKWFTLESTWSFHPLEADIYSSYDDVIEAIRFISQVRALYKGIERLEVFDKKSSPVYSYGFGLKYRLERVARRKLKRNALRKVKQFLNEEELEVLGLKKEPRVHQTAATKRREYES